MKHFLFSLFLLFLTNILSAQDSVLFLDKGRKNVSLKQEATYYRKVAQTQGGYILRDYFVSNDRLETEAECRSVSPEPEYQGKYTQYYSNGNIARTGFYDNNRREGLWKDYFENGSPDSEVEYKDGVITTYNQAWQEDGTLAVTNGNGFYSRSVPSGTSFREVKDYKLITSFSVDATADTVYLVLQKSAEYKGGLHNLYKNIGKNIEYPKQARREGVQGRVFVEFIIDRKGRVTRANVLRGIGGGCDEEAVRVLELCNDWIPASHHGKPVKQKFVLPVMFKLG